MTFIYWLIIYKERVNGYWTDLKMERVKKNYFPFSRVSAEIFFYFQN